MNSLDSIICFFLIEFSFSTNFFRPSLSLFQHESVFIPFTSQKDWTYMLVFIFRVEILLSKKFFSDKMLLHQMGEAIFILTSRWGALVHNRTTVKHSYSQCKISLNLSKLLIKLPMIFFSLN